MIGRLARAAWLRMPRPVARTVYQTADRIGWRYGVAGERVTCPACGAGAVEHLHPLPLHVRDHRARVGFASGCRRCGVVFANPMPSAESLAQMYTPDGRWGRTRNGDDARDTHPSSRYLARLCAEAGVDVDITRPAPGSAVLDFGCGAGELLDALQAHGWITYGIEPAEKGAFVRHHELATIPAAPTFTLAIAHHVLEHVEQPLQILRALGDCLLPGGFLFVSVPRLDTLAQHRDFRYCINDRAHVMSYSRDAMATLLGMAGLQAIDLNPPPHEAAHWRATKRLRMLGHKHGTPRLPPAPLDAARLAFAAWRASSSEQTPPRSVRAAAALLNFERARKARRPR